MHDALDCYVTYKDVNDMSGIKDVFGNQAIFEIFQENHNPPLNDLFDKLN